MHHLSNRDVGDEHADRYSRDAYGNPAHVAPAPASDYPCSSDQYSHDRVYPHGDASEREGATDGRSTPRNHE